MLTYADVCWRMLEGAGVCRVYDLRCSYKDALERANNKSNIREMSQADRALLLSASFVHAPSAQTTHAAAVAEGSLDSSGDASSSSDAPADKQDWELQVGIRTNLLTYADVCCMRTYAGVC